MYQKTTIVIDIGSTISLTLRNTVLNLSIGEKISLYLPVVLNERKPLYQTLMEEYKLTSQELDQLYDLLNDPTYNNTHLYFTINEKGYTSIDINNDEIEYVYYVTQDELKG